MSDLDREFRAAVKANGIKAERRSGKGPAPGRIDPQHIDEAAYAAKGLRLAGHHAFAESIDKILGRLAAYEDAAGSVPEWVDEALRDVMATAGMWPGESTPARVGFALGLIRGWLKMARTSPPKGGQGSALEADMKAAEAEARIEGLKAIGDRFRDERDEARAELKKAAVERDAARAALDATKGDLKAAAEDIAAASAEIAKVRAERDVALRVDLRYCCPDHGWRVVNPDAYGDDQARRLHAIREYIQEMDEPESTLDPDDKPAGAPEPRTISTVVKATGRNMAGQDYVVMSSPDTPDAAYLLIGPAGSLGSPSKGDEGALELTNGVDVEGGFRYTDASGDTFDGRARAVKVG